MSVERRRTKGISGGKSRLALHTTLCLLEEPQTYLLLKSGAIDSQEISIARAVSYATSRYCSNGTQHGDSRQMESAVCYIFSSRVWRLTSESM